MIHVNGPSTISLDSRVGATGSAAQPVGQRFVRKSINGFARVQKQPALGSGFVRLISGMKKVTCKTVFRELTNFMEGELDQKTHAAIERHVDSCQRCTILLHTMKKMLQIFEDEDLFADALTEDLKPRSSREPGRRNDKK